MDNIRKIINIICKSILIVALFDMILSIMVMPKREILRIVSDIDNSIDIKYELEKDYEYLTSKDMSKNELGEEIKLIEDELNLIESRAESNNSSIKILNPTDSIKAIMLKMKMKRRNDLINNEKISNEVIYFEYKLGKKMSKLDMAIKYWYIKEVLEDINLPDKYIKDTIIMISPRSLNINDKKIVLGLANSSSKDIIIGDIVSDSIALKTKLGLRLSPTTFNIVKDNIKYVLCHEIGHLVDYELDDEIKKEYLNYKNIKIDDYGKVERELFAEDFGITYFNNNFRQNNFDKYYDFLFEKEKSKNIDKEYEKIYKKILLQ